MIHARRSRLCHVVVVVVRSKGVLVAIMGMLRSSAETWQAHLCICVSRMLEGWIELRGQLLHDVRIDRHCVVVTEVAQ